MNHYVYKLTDPSTGEYYIGSRTCRCPVVDDPYRGSMATWKPDKDSLVREIIRDDFLDRLTAIQFESDRIRECVDDTLNRNYHIPDKGFCCLGLPNVNRGKVWMHSSFEGDVRVPLEMVEGYKVNGWSLGRGPFKPRTKVSKNRGKVNVVDKDGKNFRVRTDDPRLASKELRVTQEGRVWMRDPDGLNKLMPRETCDELVKVGWLLGRSPEVRQRMSESAKSKPTVSEETRQRMSIAAKLKWRGRKLALDGV